MKKTVCMAFAAMCCASAAVAAGGTERLTHHKPRHFVEGWRNTQDAKNTPNANSDFVMVEYVPKGETVHNWSEMITEQKLSGARKPAGVAQFYNSMAQLWMQHCGPKAGVQAINTDKDNGYNAAIWVQICPNNPQTNKPEYTFIKAIEGKKDFYIVQKAYRSQPSEAQVQASIDYLSQQVQLCDTADKAHACRR